MREEGGWKEKRIKKEKGRKEELRRKRLKEGKDHREITFQSHLQQQDLS